MSKIAYHGCITNLRIHLLYNNPLRKAWANQLRLGYWSTSTTQRKTTRASLKLHGVQRMLLLMDKILTSKRSATSPSIRFGAQRSGTPTAMKMTAVPTWSRWSEGRARATAEVQVMLGEHRLRTGMHTRTQTTSRLLEAASSAWTWTRNK